MWHYKALGRQRKAVPPYHGEPCSHGGMAMREISEHVAREAALAKSC